MLYLLCFQFHRLYLEPQTKNPASLSLFSRSCLSNQSLLSTKVKAFLQCNRSNSTRRDQDTNAPKRIYMEDEIREIERGKVNEERSKNT